MSNQPQLIVFDLDYTLWPFWVDTHVSPPFTKKSDGHVYDGRNKQIKSFIEVPQILQQLKDDGYDLAVASRTQWPEGGNQLINLFGWSDYFKYKEIYPGAKTAHFSKFQQQSGLPYDQMLFFDDEVRNIVQVSKLGVTAILVEDTEGVTSAMLKHGLAKFARKSNKKD